MRKAPPDTLPNGIGSALFRAFGHMWKGIEAALDPLGIRSPHFWILFSLREHGPMSQVGLMKHIAVDRTTMVHLIDDLERLGLAERARDPNDRRANVVRLKPKGENTQAEGERRMRESEERLLTSLSTEERELLRELLLRIVDEE